jgi:hypothetical protein
MSVLSQPARPTPKGSSGSHPLRPLPIRCAARLTALLLIWSFVLAAPAAALAQQPTAPATRCPSLHAPP